MNKIIVAKYFDGTQGLFDIARIMRIGREEASMYKQQWRKDKARAQALTNWCAWNQIARLDVYRMDGTLDGWIIECTEGR